MAIEVKNLTKEYTRGRETFKAANGINLTVGRGDFVSITGRSGSGKSTLLHMIAGLLAPTSGTIEIDGETIARMDDRAASAYRNTKIGYIPQGQSTLSSLSVIDNVRVPFHLFKKHGDSGELALARLKQTGISHLADSYPKHLSGGELKRVAIARALINTPDYVIADEPTSDLDAQTTSGIMKLLKGIAEGGTGVIMVTHEVDALAYGDRTFIMEEGVLYERRGHDP